jgi:hypothetical protein
MLPSDNDTVRGLGFVTLYAAYLEEQIDNLLFMLNSVQPFTEQDQRMPISARIRRAKLAVAAINFEERDELLKNLDAAKQAFEERNEFVHGRIYANFDRPDTLKSGRRNIPEREVKPEELYSLANYLADLRLAIYRPMILKIPKALVSLA